MQNIKKTWSGCVWLERMLDLSARSWAEEEEKQSRLFQQTGIQVGGRGSQSGSPVGRGE